MPQTPESLKRKHESYVLGLIGREYAMFLSRHGSFPEKISVEIVRDGDGWLLVAGNSDEQTQYPLMRSVSRIGLMRSYLSFILNENKVESTHELELLLEARGF